MSADLQDALIDLVLRLYRGLFVPGDQLAEFLALDAVGPGSVQSGILSAALWLAAFVSIVASYRIVRNVDRALTALVLGGYEGLRRALRVVALRLGFAFRSYAHERQARLSRTEVAELPALTALQL